MHRFRDIQVRIFDWTLGLGLLPDTSELSAGWNQSKTSANTIFMVLNTGIPVLTKLSYKNLQKNTFGEGQVQDPIPALPGHESKFRTPERHIVLSFYSNFQLSGCINGEKLTNKAEMQKQISALTKLTLLTYKFLKTLHR
jgi:hypothetical protein